VGFQGEQYLAQRRRELIARPGPGTTKEFGPALDARRLP
jgi:hypothetical protein